MKLEAMAVPRGSIVYVQGEEGHVLTQKEVDDLKKTLRSSLGYDVPVITNLSQFVVIAAPEKFAGEVADIPDKDTLS